MAIIVAVLGCTFRFHLHAFIRCFYFQVGRYERNKMSWSVLQAIYRFCKSTQRKLKIQNSCTRFAQAGCRNLKNLKHSCRIYFIGFETLYHVLFFLFSFAALVHSGYWYSGCLLYMFLKSKLLAQVLVALFQSGEAFTSRA